MIYICTVIIILSNNTLFSAAKKGPSFSRDQIGKGETAGQSTRARTQGLVLRGCFDLQAPSRHETPEDQNTYCSLAALNSSTIEVITFPLHILAELPPRGPGTGVCPPDLEDTADLPFIVTPFLDSKARGRIGSYFSLLLQNYRARLTKPLRKTLNPQLPLVR
ncbi:hypothetical protein DTO271G3_5742 [Paecilomyces variotii]|nr:hypothetical protein DTO271G3_5742 [Paecilomyces variotii]